MQVSESSPSLTQRRFTLFQKPPFELIREMQSSEKTSVKLMEVIESFFHDTSEDRSRYSRSHLQRYAEKSNPFPSSEKTSVKLVEVIGSFSQHTFEEGSRYSRNHLQR
jgi:hypothetical protein